MIERGLLVGGEIVAGTEWVLRDPACWWPPGHHSTRPRAPDQVTDLLVGHWTAGHISHEDEAGPRTYRAMLARRSTRRPGQPLDVAVQLVIGWGGSVWQLADLTTACVHVGDRGVIARSIGVECRWPGTRRQAEHLGIDGAWATVRVGGQRLEVMLPSAELLASWVRVAEVIAELRGQHGIAVPRRVPAGATKRWTSAEQRAWAGAQEHAHVPGSTKIDAAGLLIGALADHGWAA